MYVAAADFRVKGIKPWTANLLLSEGDGTDAYLDLIIAQVTTQVELDLSDDFEPPTPDDDETLDITGSGQVRLYVPRRIRSLTTVKTRDDEGVLTEQGSTLWRLRKSLNAAGTAMFDGRRLDWLDVVDTLVTLGTWYWPRGDQTVQLVGKFGWAAVPTDIKRLVALKVYDIVKSSRDPYGRITQKSTVDALITYEEVGREEREIVERYSRKTPMVVG